MSASWRGIPSLRLGAATARAPAATLLALLVLCTSSSSTWAQSWPVTGQNLQRTAHQPLPADISEPAVRWQIPLGGGLEPEQWLAADVDIDGQVEVVLIRAGHVLAYRFDGRLLWASPTLAVGAVVAVDDLDGDGAREVIAAGQSSGLVVLDGATGQVRWQLELEPSQFLGDVFPLEVPDLGTLLYVADLGCAMSGRGTARLYSFSDGLLASHLTTQLDLSDHGYWCGRLQAAGDIDGNGSVELVTLSDDHVIAYDVVSGDPTLSSPALGSFPFGRARTQVIDVDGDGDDDVLVASDEPGTVDTAKRLLMLEVGEGGDQLDLRWSLDVHPQEGRHRFPDRLAADLLAGGPLEIATSYYDPADERWHTVIVAGTAEAPLPPLLDIGDRVLLALVDLDGDSVAELVTVDTSELTLPRFGTLRAYHLEAGPGGSGPHLIELWAVDGAALPRYQRPWQRLSAPLLLVDGETPSLLVSGDADGDRRPESVWSIEISGDVVAERSLPPGANVSALVPLPGQASVALSRTDGYIELLDVGLAVQNPYGDSGASSLRVGSYTPPGLVAWRGDDESYLALADPDAAPVLYSIAHGSTAGPQLAWRRDDVVAEPSVSLAAPVQMIGATGLVAWRARQPDQSLTLVTAHPATGTDDQLFAIEADGAVLPFNDIAWLRDPDGATESYAYSLFDEQTAEISHFLIDPEDGSPDRLPLDRTLRCTWERPASIWDASGDDHDDYYTTQGADIRVVDGVTGVLLEEATGPKCGGLLTLLDIDGLEPIDILRQGSFGPLRVDADFEIVWEFERHVRYQPGAVAPLDEGGFSLGAARFGTPELVLLRASDGLLLAETVLADGQAFETIEAAEAAGAPLGSLSATIAVDALAEGGEAAFLVGSTDGHLYAVSAEDAALVWALNLRGTVGTPIAADLDGDDASEIAVPVGDGSIYVVDTPSLEPVPWVYDTDGRFVATSDDEDLDVLFGSTRLGANWGAVEGATGYEYQVVREADDVVLVPWTDVGPAQRFARDDLSLTRGHRYLNLVRAYARDPSERISVVTASDGFAVDDGLPPSLSLHVEPFVIFPEGGGPEQAHIELLIRDDVGLTEARLWIESGDGSLVVQLAAERIGGTEQRLARAWSGRDDSGELVPGATYLVRGEAVDQSERRSHVDTQIVVCRATNADWPECGSPDDVGPGDDSADTGTADADATVEPAGDGGHPDAGDEVAFGDVLGRTDAGDLADSPPADAGPFGAGRPDDGCGCRSLLDQRRGRRPDHRGVFWMALVVVAAASLRSRTGRRRRQASGAKDANPVGPDPAHP